MGEELPTNGEPAEVPNDGGGSSAPSPEAIITIDTTSEAKFINNLPISYRENLPAEKKALELIENFRLQYVHLYRDRMPLLLNPLNEARVEKPITSFIKTTLLEYPEFFQWAGVANFIKDYLTLQTLDPPTKLPNNLSSPQTVLSHQVANCFEYSHVLVSLLIGCGYDAYCVSGYATREICLADESFEECQSLDKKTEEIIETKKRETKKYQIRKPKDLTSKFEAMMAQREVDEVERTKVETENRLKQEQLDNEKPESDDLYGRRIHCWVLVRAGQRAVPVDFFIEPLTGVSYSCSDERFLGVESVWNGRNLWVCIEDGSSGCNTLNWDLKDITSWEPLVAAGNNLDEKGDDNDDDDLDQDEQDDNKPKFEIEPDLPHSLPPSWCDDISIDQQQYESRSPNGRKVIRYKRAICELFAPYLENNGLVNRTTRYRDMECSEAIEEKSTFKNRKDLLHIKTINFITREVVEEFHRGRANSLKRHTYILESYGISETKREMDFFQTSRPDGLTNLSEVDNLIVQHFSGREDRLYYREIKFGKRPKKLSPANGGNTPTKIVEKVPRPIEVILEKFHRSSAVDANEDVMEQKFLMGKEKINVIYHRKDGRITSSSRNFEKPENADDKAWNVSFSSDMTNCFYSSDGADSGEPDKQLPIYKNLVNMLKAEQTAVKSTRELEDQIKALLALRKREDRLPILEISIHDTFRNEKAKKRREEIRKQKELEAKRQQETEMDYLAPFLAQIGDPVHLSRQQATKLREECLADLKQRLIDQANLIQERFEHETRELQSKQQEYQQRQVAMTKEDEEAYRNWCAEAMFRIEILEMRLNRHKQLAPKKYAELDQKLKADARIIKC